MAEYIITKTEYFVRETTTTVRTDESPAKAMALAISVLDNPNNKEASQAYYLPDCDEYTIQNGAAMETRVEAEMIPDDEG